MRIRLFTVLPMLTIFTLCAHAAGKENWTEVYGWSHEVVSPRDAATAQRLHNALQRFEREISGKRRGRAAASSKPKEIVVVGSKVKDVVRSPRAGAGGFSDVSGLDAEVDVVEYRTGGPASLPQLQGAIRRFEAAAGPRGTCVGNCRNVARRCLARCRDRMRKRRVSGKCICAHLQARCLLRQTGQGKCFPRRDIHPPEPVKKRQIR